MSSIMDVIRPELSELYALELENLPYLNPSQRSGGGYTGIAMAFRPSVCLSVETILSRAILLQFCTYCSEIYYT